jgi:hypothetical protein
MAAIDLAPVYDGARQAGFPMDGMAHAQDTSDVTTRVSVRINHGKPVPTLDDTRAGGLEAGKYNDCWLFLEVHHTIVDGQPYYRVSSSCEDSERREDAPGGGAKGTEGTDLASCVRVAIAKQGVNAEGLLEPCEEARTARDKRRRERDAQPVVPVAEPWTADDQKKAEEGEADDEGSGPPILAILVGIAVLFVLITGVAVFAKVGPFQPATHTAGSGTQLPPSAKAFGTSLNGTSAELSFAGFVLGTCPPQDQQYMGSMFTGGWKTTVGPGAGVLQSVNMLGLSTSFAAPALNGNLPPDGALDVSGDSSVEFLHLQLQISKPPAGPLTAPVRVTGMAMVKLHFVGTPAIGTVTGDCGATYNQVTGTFSPAP